MVFFFSQEKLALLSLLKEVKTSPDCKINLFPPLAKTRSRMTTATTFSRQNDAASRASATLRKSGTRRLSYSSSFSFQNKLSNIQRLLLLLKHTSSPFNTSDPSLSLSSSFFFWQSASALETLKLNTNKQFKLLDKNKNYGYYDTKLKKQNKTKQYDVLCY